MLNVIEFPQNNINDIPKLLRRLADQIEREDSINTESLAIVAENEYGDITIYGMGKAHQDKAISLFSAGIFELNMLRRGD